MGTHPELISSGSFDEKFKTALLNYYTYGFKNINKIKEERKIKTNKTINEDWMRLNTILSDYLKWEKTEDGVRFASLDSQSMPENPFHRVYHCCRFNENDPVAFFNIVMALSDRFDISQSSEKEFYKRLGITIDSEVEKRKRYEYLSKMKEHTGQSIELQKYSQDVYYFTVVSDEKKISTEVSEEDEKFVEDIKKKWNDIVSENLDKELKEIEDKFYQKIDQSEIKSIKKYIEFFFKNIGKKIESEKYSVTKYRLLANNEPIRSEKDKDLEVLQKDKDFIERLLELRKFVKEHAEVTIQSENIEDVNENIQNCIRIGETELRKLIGIKEGIVEELILKSKVDEEWANIALQAKEDIGIFAEKYKEYIIKGLDQQFKELKESFETKKLSASQLQCFFQNKNVALFSGNNNAIEKRLSKMEKMELLRKEKFSVEYCYELKKLVVNNIISEIHQNVGHRFEQRFFYSLDFFSKYYLLGEVGTFLCDRIGIETDKSPFRFKHEYFMQSLNDFNIIDLLYAIENNKWCKIGYSHGTEGFVIERLCYPLEIRISNMSGREFFMCYDPLKRCFSVLRIEFIDSIEFYEDEAVKRALKKYNEEISEAQIKKDIENVRNSIRYLWGVSTGEKQVDNASAVLKTKIVSLKILYDSKKEYFIRNRLERERRCGNYKETVENGKSYLYYTAEVVDEKELRPWVRSFYSRIIECKGMDVESSFVETYIKNRVNVFLAKAQLNSTSMEMEFMKEDVFCSSNTDEKPETRKDRAEEWRMPTKVKNLLGQGEKARIHEELFNEMFSFYYYFIGKEYDGLINKPKNQSQNQDLLFKCKEENEESSYTEEDIEDKVRKVIKGGRISGTPQGHVKLLIEGKFLVKNMEKNSNTYYPKFKIKCTDKNQKPQEQGEDIRLYRDVIPLTGIELRWLKTVLDDPKMELFLDEEEIKAIKDVLNRYDSDIRKLPMDKVTYYDRFHLLEKDEKNDAKMLRDLLYAITNKYIVKITYQTMKGKKLEGEYRPIVIEFSKRTNCFQAYLQECGHEERICIMNLSGITEVNIRAQKNFDYQCVQQALAKYRENNTVSVTVEFYDTKNMADRILTEFSPWKKECTYNEISGLYTLKIYYQRQDETELVIRLLGYGAALRFVDQNHSICKEIKERLNKQMDLLLEHDRNQVGREAGDER